MPAQHRNLLLPAWQLLKAAVCSLAWSGHITPSALVLPPAKTIATALRYFGSTGLVPDLLCMSLEWHVPCLPAVTAERSCSSSWGWRICGDASHSPRARERFAAAPQEGGSKIICRHVLMLFHSNSQLQLKIIYSSL